MSDVEETLQQLVERRLREMGRERGRNEPLSLREAYLATQEHERKVGYEVLRRVRVGTHSNIGDDAADTLATMLHVPVGDVLRAAGRRPRLGRFELPRRADRLTAEERQVVLNVVDAILEAGERPLRRPDFVQTESKGDPVVIELKHGRELSREDQAVIERMERIIFADPPDQAAARKVTRKGHEDPDVSE